MRLFPGLSSETNLTQRAYSKPCSIASRLHIPDALKRLRQSFGAQTELRVLEIGAGSGRFTKHAIRSFGIKPENCVIADLDYGKKQGPFLVREVHEQVKKGKIRQLNLDVTKPPLEWLGKFHLIIVPNVLRDNRSVHGSNKNVILNLALNYGKFIGKGGNIIANRVSRQDFKSLKQTLSRLGFDSKYFSNINVDYCVLKLIKRNE